MKKTLQNTDNYSPTEKQSAFLEAYLSQEVRMSIDELCKTADVSRQTYYEWVKDHDFNKWFYEQIQANKYRFAPRIIDNCFTKAMLKEATVQDRELALRVLEVYTPTEKHINENYDIKYSDFMKTIKDKAKKLSKLKVTASGIVKKEKIDD